MSRNPEPEGACELPDVGLKAWVLLPLFDVAWPMPNPAPRTAIAAAPASRPLRTRWLPAAAGAAAGGGVDQVGAPGSVGGPPKDDAGPAPSIGLPARAPMAYVPWGGVEPAVGVGSCATPAGGVSNCSGSGSGCSGRR